MMIRPQLISVVMIIALAWLHSAPLASSAPVDNTATTDVVDLTSGIRQYLQLMATSMTKGLGYSSESNVNTFNSAMTLEAEKPYGIDASTKEGEEILKQMELQSIFTDHDLGEKNLMWSLRGSHSDEKSPNEEVPEPIYFRRLTDVAEGWVTRMINAVYNYEAFDGHNQLLFHNMSPQVRRTAHQTSIYFKH